MAGCSLGCARTLLATSASMSLWAVVSVITGGAGVLAYLVAWAIIPDEGQKSSIAENMAGKKQDSYSG
jgi:phage shock protein PspC (stress-responsive transcriptional regulator)